VARKEINVFSVAFLDLLSGALAAVIILFVIVPKLSSEDIPIVEEMKGLDMTVDEINDLLEKIQSTMPVAIFDSISNLVGLMEDESDELKKSLHSYKKYKLWMDTCQYTLESNCPVDYSAYFNWMQACEKELDDPCPPKNNPSTNTSGMKFAGKRVLFLLDVSGSMLERVCVYGPGDTITTPNNVLASVKAAMKLLITSMDDDFYVDVMSFTTLKGTNNPDLNPIFGNLVPLVDKSNRDELSEKIYDFEATNGTPTREALLYGCKNYTDATDIVLLTDGMPFYEGNYDTDLVNKATAGNSIGAAIHTIIVGKMCDNNTDKDVLEQMMIDLAKRNNGKSIRLKN
jgi:hypothetical protein